MSDYNTHVGILRDKMIDMLTENDEQLVYVLSGVLGHFAEIDDIIELGSLEDPERKFAVVTHLRTLADAIEGGEIT